MDRFGAGVMRATIPIRSSSDEIQKLPYRCPPDLAGLFLNLLYLGDAKAQLGRMLRFALGKLSAEEQDFYLGRN
jgi:hypothetical protein